MPSPAPTLVPTMPPTGALDGCEIEPPSCALSPPDEADRVAFCLVIGETQVELCVRIENVQGLLGRGERSLVAREQYISCIMRPN